jgi:hypothetical protein
LCVGQAAFAANNRSATQQLSATLLATIADYDALLSSDEHFMVRALGCAHHPCVSM